MGNAQLSTDLVKYWDLVPAVVGGVIGALAGGIPALLLAKRQSDETLKRDSEQRVEEQKALAFSASVKLLIITNSIISLSNHVKSCMTLLAEHKHAGMEPWQVLLPMIGHTDEGTVRFSPAEMAVFAAAKDYVLMQDMLLLAARNSSSLSIFQSYCSMREEFIKTRLKPATFDGQLGQSMVTGQELTSYKPYTIPLNNLAVGLDAGIDEDLSLARSVSDRFAPAANKYFKVSEFSPFRFPTDDEIVKLRKPLPV